MLRRTRTQVPAAWPCRLSPRCVNSEICSWRDVGTEPGVLCPGDVPLQPEVVLAGPQSHSASPFISRVEAPEWMRADRFSARLPVAYRQRQAEMQLQHLLRVRVPDELWSVAMWKNGAILRARPDVFDDLLKKYEGSFGPVWITRGALRQQHLPQNGRPPTVYPMLWRGPSERETR